MSWLGIHGHDPLRAAFARAHHQGRLGHSYLFTGPEGIGKKRFALALAQAISCLHPQPDLEPCSNCSACTQIHAGTSPDLHLYGLPEEKHEFPIALMQDVIKSLAMKSSREGTRRIVIVDDADALNEESANCFLKSLEEPPPDSLLILIGTAAERQLATILSRCQVIRFQPLGLNDFQTAAVEAGITGTKQEAEKLFPSAKGSLARARLMLDSDIQSLRTDIAKSLQAPRWDSVGLGTLLTKFCDVTKESSQKRQRALFAVEVIITLLHQALQQAEAGLMTPSAPPVIAKLASIPSIEALPAMIEICMEAEAQIERRFQLALILEAFADRLGKVSRLVA